MFKKKNKEDLRADMQSDNIYLVEEISRTDWESLKSFDAFLIALLEMTNQNPIFGQIITKMASNGFNIEDAKKSLEVRKSLRKRIVGDKDVERLKNEYRLNVEEVKGLKIEIQYYKDIFKASKKRPYSEQEFKQKTDRLKGLEDWLLGNTWIANHQLT